MRSAIVMAAFLAAAPAAASECFQLAQRGGTALHKASFQLETGQVGIRFIGHATYLVETDEGLTIATDWSGDFERRLGLTPDVITMNHAHETHWTPSPDPEIAHPLQGWGDGETPTLHFLRLGETLIRNVPTDIRSFGTEKFGNSIFIFEHKGLCIGHLGHLHHMPTEEQFAMIGRLDVVMAPVDGGYTLSVDEMTALLKRIKARVVLPMHAFGPYSLRAFLAEMREEFEVVYDDDDEIVLSMDALPDAPTVIVPKSL